MVVGRNVTISVIAVCFLLAFSGTVFAWGGINVERLSDGDITKVETILGKLMPVVQERRQKSNLATLTFSELYAPLSDDENDFLKNIQALDAKKLGINIPFQGIATGQEDLVVIKSQKVIVNGQTDVIPPQFLPKEVFSKYQEMMDAMGKDLGRRLYVRSGYRSSAYQLYLFISYLKNHGYSIKETAKFSAIPGYSEHGAPKHQAIDFVNKDGVDGQGNPKAFEALAEFKWLEKNAAKFGFALSYPKNSKDGITYEPWHWHYEPDAK
jgi:LAS superfamily LD-carboxypeptidase LdcB